MKNKQEGQVIVPIEVITSKRCLQKERWLLLEEDNFTWDCWY